jgi:hypothetical protein
MVGTAGVCQHPQGASGAGTLAGGGRGSPLGYRRAKGALANFPVTRLLGGCHPDPALREKDPCHFA